MLRRNILGMDVMERRSCTLPPCTLAGRGAVCALAMAAAWGAVLLEQVSPPWAVLAGLAPLVGMLWWEVARLRRALAWEQAAHRGRSALLADMSHELRTPLNAIIGFSELIGDEVLAPHDLAKYRECARDIHQAATHLLHLINDVLDLSKIDAGHMELAERPTDLEDLLLGCQRLLHDQIRRGGLQLTVALDPELPQVRCDPLKVTQVLLNLMSNAIKFTPTGGHIRVLARRNGRGMAVAVQDDGVGIAAADLARVLTPFAQAAPPLRPQDQGTGLGLPLSKRLMELHGGRLELHSQVGSGTCVTVTFPAERCLPAAVHRPRRLCEVPAHA